MHAFRRHFLYAGLPVGLMIAFGMAIRGPSTLWWDLLLTIGVPATLMAGALVAVTEPFVRAVRRSPLTASILVALTLVVTVVGGSALLLAAAHLPHGRWMRLPDPPTSTQSFAGPTCYELGDSERGIVYVSTSDGVPFAFHRGSGEPADWRRVAALPDSGGKQSAFCQVQRGDRATPYKRGRALAAHRIDDIGADCGGRRHYLLMSDHSVWTWSTGGCALSQVSGYFFFLIAVVVLGFNAGVRRLSANASAPWVRA